MAWIAMLLACGLQSGSLSGGDGSRPYVVRTVPEAGDRAVDPTTTELVVEFNEPMMPSSWSWVQRDSRTYPETTGDPVYVSATTIKLPVKLEPDRDYVMYINSEPKFLNFKDAAGTPAVPFVLTFHTAKGE